MTACCFEGRHDPRDPPPGEEQPADDLVAAAPAGPPARVARGQGGHRGVGAAHPLDRARARDRCRARPATTSPSSRSSARSCAWSRRASQSPDRPVRFKIDGDAGNLPATVATPLAVVLTELLQNAVDHAYPDETARPAARSRCRMVERRTRARGAGERRRRRAAGRASRSTTSTGLGLSIVRTLVTTRAAGHHRDARRARRAPRCTTAAPDPGDLRVTGCAALRRSGERRATESSGRSARRGAGGRATGDAACGAPPRRCRPRRPSPGWW